VPATNAETVSSADDGEDRSTVLWLSELTYKYKFHLNNNAVKRNNFSALSYSPSRTHTGRKLQIQNYSRARDGSGKGGRCQGKQALKGEP